MSPAPKINSRFFCLVNRDQKTLAALISACLNIPGTYLPLLEVPAVEDSKPEDKNDPFHENYIMANRANTFSIRASNMLSRLERCEYVILGGITDQEKEFIDFLSGRNVIEINSPSDVRDFLEPISGKSDVLTCREEDVCNGVYAACLENRVLRIDEDAARIAVPLAYKSEGLILIEEENHVRTIIGINYAISINAEIKVVKPPGTDIFEVKNFLREWKSGKTAAFTELKAKLFRNIEHINFPKYAFATFFTSCAPYGLILENIIPFTYVHSWFRPDFFVFNNIYTYSNPQVHSAMVFSPREFGDKEETGFVVRKLVDKNYLVKKLIGNPATVYNLDNHIREYPHQILHICSHGGEVSGYPVKLEFTDRDGVSHTIEYDDVVSFAPTKAEKLIEVTHKYIFRTFDGFRWRSKEFKEKEYEHHVFTSMMKSISDAKPKYGKRIEAVDDSCAIKCVDFVYQAMFNALAGQRISPFIFNNTCWSWSGISDAFLDSGATGYIGTLWDVGNADAVAFAESFYEDAFEKSILESFHNAMKTLTGDNVNIYLFWGLHFSQFTTGSDINATKIKVASSMLESFYYWLDKTEATTDPKDKDKFRRLQDWNFDQLFRFYSNEVTSILKPVTR